MSYVVWERWFLGPEGTEYIASMARDAVWEETEKIHARAEALLAAAASAVKIADPSGLTRIDSEMEGNDGIVSMWGYKHGALAIEFGHYPFGCVCGHPTKPPSGLYIITRAAGLGGSRGTKARAAAHSARTGGGR